MKKSWKIILIAVIILIFPSITLAAELLEKVDFYIDPSYDSENREKITAVLQRITDQLYFYLDEDWWEGLSIEKQKEVNQLISELSQEFENTIYPILTLNYGSEWKPGIDEDNRITILIHPMKKEAGGYFNPGDEYPWAQVAKSNQREMIYLNSKQITSPLNKSFLAHEFTHLITFNQKEKKYGVSEEVWLNEARAEYSPTLVGYDEIYQNSYLQRRVKAFLEKPQDSLTEWQGNDSDYGVANLFIQYLVDHYGKEILIDSLKSNKTGILSLNYALEKNGFSEDFSQIFTNWLIAVFINDCQVGSKYCYLNENLKNLRVTPFIYFLPTTGESTLNVGYLTKDWTGNWQKIIGGRGSLKLEFSAGSGARFKVPYVLETTEGKSVGFLELNQSQKGTVYLKDEKIISLTLIPSTQNKISNFSENEPSYQFSWSAVTEKSTKKEEALIVIRLLDTEFPDYKDVILPKKEDKRNIITVNRKLLLESMRRMIIIGGDQYQGVKITIGTDYLEMVSVNPDLGDVEEKIEIKYDGEPIEIGFNPKYFIDALQTMDSDIIFLDIKDQTSPCLITGEQDQGFLGLIMPMRV